MMKSNGLDCSELEAALAAGEENEMTILYEIYLRDCQADRVNWTLRMAMLNLASPREHRSLPLIGPASQPAPVAGHQSHEWGKLRENHQGTHYSRREEPNRRAERSPWLNGAFQKAVGASTDTRVHKAMKICVHIRVAGELWT
jgi:hypothetical protein